MNTHKKINVSTSVLTLLSLTSKPLWSSSPGSYYQVDTDYQFVCLFACRYMSVCLSISVCAVVSVRALAWWMCMKECVRTCSVDLGVSLYVYACVCMCSYVRQRERGGGGDVVGGVRDDETDMQRQKKFTEPWTCEYLPTTIHASF